MSRHLFVNLAWGNMWGEMTSSDEPEPPNPFPDRETNERVTELFQYPKLHDPKALRLLHLLPGTRQDDIACRLVASNLDEAEDQYEALSYVWGDVSDKTPIQVNDHTCYIGGNLRSALLNLRLEDATRVLWADAICINQLDIDERQSQVSIMRDIYRYAKQTIVWLGAASKETRSAFGILEELAQEAQDIKRTGRTVEPKKELIKKLSTDVSLEHTVYEHDWWDRVWTAQEIVLAKDATIACGGFRVGWDGFCDGVDLTIKLEVNDGVYFGTPVKTLTSEYSQLKALREWKPMGFGTMADELLALMITMRRRDATDPRDKVFAVLGLVQLGRPEDLGIQPDYCASSDVVYRRAAQALIEHSGNLDVLGMCYPHEKSKVEASDLPSWVPDWSPTDEVAPPLMTDALDRRRETHASKGTKAQAGWRNGTTLVVQGHIVDSISKLSKVQRNIDGNVWDTDDINFDDDDEPLSTTLYDIGRLFGRFYKNFTDMVPYLSIFLEWESFAKDLKPTNAIHSPREVADPAMAILCQTLCTGTTAPEGPEATEKMFQYWHDTLAPIRNLRRLRVDKVGSVFRSAGLMSYVAKTWDAYGEFPKYMTQAMERRVGATRKGWLGLLPKDTRVGDQLALLRGGRVPVILRPHESGDVTLVGEAYVHGIMDGEAFDEEKCHEISIR